MRTSILPFQACLFVTCFASLMGDPEFQQVAFKDVLRLRIDLAVGIYIYVYINRDDHDWTPKLDQIGTNQ